MFILKKMVTGTSFLLVTSASHMRTMALSRKLGMNPMPAPADFMLQKRQGIHPGGFFPNAGAVRRMERAFHEYLGLIWSRIRRQI